MVDSAVDTWGRVDIVMASAAIHLWVGSVLELPEETFNKFMQVNVQGSIWLAQMTVPGMLDRGYGCFIVVGSVVGLLGDPLTGTYGLTKAADMQLVRNMANEFASKGITATQSLEAWNDDLQRAASTGCTRGKRTQSCGELAQLVAQQPHGNEPSA